MYKAIYKGFPTPVIASKGPPFREGIDLDVFFLFPGK